MHSKYNNSIMSLFDVPINITNNDTNQTYH